MCGKGYGFRWDEIDFSGNLIYNIGNPEGTFPRPGLLKDLLTKVK